MNVTANQAGYVDPVAMGPDPKFFEEIIGNLSQFGTEDQMYQWRNELFSQQTVDFRDKAAVLAWYHAIYRQHGPGLAGRSLCTVRRPLYYASKAPQNLPVSASIFCGDYFCVNR